MEASMSQPELHDLSDWLAEYDEDLLLADGLDAAVIGIVERCGQEPFAVYDAERCIELLVEQGMDEDEAAEFFSCNVAGAWMGPHTPGFLIRPPPAGSPGIPPGTPAAQPDLFDPAA
jgi:hypothetical protein